MNTDLLLKAYTLMCQASAMSEIYENNRDICKYVHSTSRGHEAIQLATAFHLLPCDFVSPYYRDESMLLGLGFTPYELMLQLLAKADDPFTGGREYYSHPNSLSTTTPRIIHQSSATGMQAIPSAGIAQGLQYLEKISSHKLMNGPNGEHPVVVCSMGDASLTEGEVSEAFQFSVLKKLPIIFLVQDNQWGISVTAKEARAMDAFQYAGGFTGLDRLRIDGSSFVDSYEAMRFVFARVRNQRVPFLVQANVPLLGHHTSGVRKEFYRPDEDLSTSSQQDPKLRLREYLGREGIAASLLSSIESEQQSYITEEFRRASDAPEPDPSTVAEHIFAPAAVTAESGTRAPEGNQKVMMVDAALFAIREIMEEYPEAIFFGQDVGRRLGGVFREAATLAELFGEHRVFNTAIQEAYLIGSTVGLSATGVKPITEVQFADYVYPGFNQLVTEVAKSCYLSCGKFPVQMVLRVPTGAYGGGGPYHSASIETTLLSVKGIKVVYPSNAADMKGLMKAAFLDPNPVVVLEHKGLYWGKVKGTDAAKRIEPSPDYVVPLGKGLTVLNADNEFVSSGDSCCIITYGMGVYWSLAAAQDFPGQVEVVDLRSLHPLDEQLVFDTVKRHGRCLVLTEEQQTNSFAESLAYRITRNCFQWLDQPVAVLGALDVPAIPMNIGLERAVLPNALKVSQLLEQLLEE
jgi:2-oxoisovalerate dehydrogenase E1 component